jgi:hypothetical protein
MTIAGLTFTVTQAGTGGGGTNVIVNPGFESGTTPWVLRTGDSQYRRLSAQASRTIINGVNSSSGTLYQQVMVGAAAPPELLAEHHYQ